MPAGLEVIGDHGFYQIDENSTFNMTMRSSGTISLTNLYVTGQLGEMRWADIEVPNAHTPMVALRTEPSWRLDGGFGIIGYRLVGSTAYIRVAGCGLSPDAGYPTNFTLKYWVFDRPVSLSSGVGLEVYDASGGLRYSSQSRPLEVAHVGQGFYDNSRDFAIISNSAVEYQWSYDDTADTSQWTINFRGWKTGFHDVASQYSFMTETYWEVLSGSASGRDDGPGFYNGLDHTVLSTPTPIIIDVTNL